MSHLYSAMAILIQYPFVAALVGALLLALGQHVRRKTVVLVGVIWLLYAAYETGMQQRWLCTGECNIRVDLLLLYPVLLGGLIVSGVSLFRARPSRAASRRK